jgi:hypothetical protein
VCNQYSPAFEEQSDYYIEFKDCKSGLQFRQKMIRHLSAEEVRKQQHVKDVVKTAHAQRSRTDENDAATAHYATLV